MTELKGALKPGSRIGILGGGQLGRMLAVAAQRLGYSVHIYGTNAAAPAFDVTRFTTIGDYDDTAALTEFAQSVDVVTFEFENIPAAALGLISTFTPVAPGPQALKATQDRLMEKQFIRDAGCQCADFASFESLAEFDLAYKEIGRPAVAKRRLMGYDGKGQIVIKGPKDAKAAQAEFDGIPSILERLIPFDREVSVIVARSRTGEVAAYPVAENTHENHVLACTNIPATLSPAMEAKAKVMATRLANALDYVGVMAVEMFVTDKDQTLLVNEIAPRVHNSGHWTIEGAVTSQFEQHIRAICGLPLGATDALGRIEMRNLLGEDVLQMTDILSDPQAHYHNYGKEPRTGRKTGHVTRVYPFTEKS